MKHAAVKEALNLGFLTDQERNRILLEATAVQTRIYNERLEAAKDEGKLEGKLELARKVLARTLSSSALEVAMDHLSGLESAEAIDDALMAMMAGNCGGADRRNVHTRAILKTSRTTRVSSTSSKRSGGNDQQVHACCNCPNHASINL